MKWIILVILLIISVNYEAKEKIIVDQKICQNTITEIDNINKRMKAGYSIRRGEYYKERLRKLKKVKYECWKKRLPKK